MDLTIVQPVIDALLTPILKWIAAHPGLVLLFGALWYVASNAIAAMPAPDEVKDAGWKYRAVYNFLHGLAGNLPRFLQWLRIQPKQANSNSPGVQQP